MWEIASSAGKPHTATKARRGARGALGPAARAGDGDGWMDIFVANDGVCPLTPLTERLGAERGSVSDIFLPDAVARTIPLWSSALLILAAVAHARSFLRQ